MAGIVVTASQLKMEAENLHGLNQELKGRIQELVLRENELHNLWEGKAKEAFHTVFNKDKEQMEAFRNLVQKYIQTLMVIADKYEKVEQANTEIALRRTY